MRPPINQWAIAASAITVLDHLLAVASGYRIAPLPGDPAYVRIESIPGKQPAFWTRRLQSSESLHEALQHLYARDAKVRAELDAEGLSLPTVANGGRWGQAFDHGRHGDDNHRGIDDVADRIMRRQYAMNAHPSDAPAPQRQLTPTPESQDTLMPYPVRYTPEDALRAIEARIDGRWDDPALVRFGPLLTDTVADIRGIIASTDRAGDPAAEAAAAKAWVETASRQGWDDQTLIELFERFIDDRGLNAAFAAYVATIAAGENEAVEPGTAGGPSP